MGRVSLLKRISTALQVLRGTPAGDWNSYFGTSSMRLLTKAGTKIDEISAMSISALYAALNFLGGVVASLPLRLYRSLPDGGKGKATEHPLYDRLHAKPNGSMTSWQWIYTSLLHKYLWGNWWSWLDRRSSEITPLFPDRTWIDPRKPELVWTKDNQGKPFFIARSDVLLVPHVSIGGVTGKGIIHYARESLGLIKAQDEFASNFFGGGIKAGGFVEVPPEQKMDEETRLGLQKDFNDRYGKLGESWKAIFLTQGAKWHGHDIDPQKAQTLESRQFSIAEISRWTGLPPHLLHDLSRATFSNIEELDLALVTFTLTPIVTQIEQAMNVIFLDERERAAGYYTKFDLKGLLRGNLQARAQFYTQMLDRGVFHADDVLELEDMNPQPDGLGKIYTLPPNLVNKRTILNPQSLRIEPARNITPKRAAISAPAKIVLQRISALRRKITISYSKKWRSYADQLLGEEIAGLRPGIQQWLGERSVGEFKTWLNTFYGDFQKKVDELSTPLLSSYADAILPVTQQEVGSETDLTAQMQSFLGGKGGYREAFVQRHVRHSSSGLLAAIADAEDPEQAAEELLAAWEEERPETIQLYESVRAENAFARNIFQLAGIMKIRSIAYSDDCPYCMALNGKVIGIEESFLTAGEFMPDGADIPLVVTGALRHPPYHGGCDCGIEASV